MKSIVKDCRTLISENRLEETIELLSSAVSIGDSENEIILQRSNLKQLEIENRKGVISESDYQQNLNKLKNSLLLLLDDLENDSLDFKRKNNKAKKSKRLVSVLIACLVLAIFGILFSKLLPIPNLTFQEDLTSKQFIIQNYRKIESISIIGATLEGTLPKIKDSLISFLNDGGKLNIGLISNDSTVVNLFVFNDEKKFQNLKTEIEVSEDIINEINERVPQNSLTYVKISYPLGEKIVLLKMKSGEELIWVKKYSLKDGYIADAIIYNEVIDSKQQPGIFNFYKNHLSYLLMYFGS